MKILSTSKQIENFLGMEPLQAASIRVTRACNLKCEQCYSFSGTRGENELTFSEIKRILDELEKLGTIRLFFTGGEPFIRPDMVDILEYADKKGFAFYISTNGVLVNDKIINSLSSLKHLKTFQVSIDGMEKMHDEIRGKRGTFIKAIKTLEMAKKKLKSVKITSVFTLMKKNAEESKMVLKTLMDMNVDTFAVVPLYPVKRLQNAKDISPKEKFKLFQELCGEFKSIKNKKTKLALSFLVPPAIMPKAVRNTEFGCGYLCTFPSILGIDANGNVAPCDGLLDHKEFILGNIRNNSLENLWNSSIMKDLRNIKAEEIEGCCKSCKHLDFCAGGCRARAYIEYGNFRAANPLCQSFYENNLME